MSRIDAHGDFSLARTFVKDIRPISSRFKRYSLSLSTVCWYFIDYCLQIYRRCKKQEWLLCSGLTVDHLYPLKANLIESEITKTRRTSCKRIYCNTFIEGTNRLLRLFLSLHIVVVEANILHCIFIYVHPWTFRFVIKQILLTTLSEKHITLLDSTRATVLRFRTYRSRSIENLKLNFEI